MGSVVKLHNTNTDTTRVSVNGRAVNVPNNEDTPVAACYVDALRNSNVNFTVIREIDDAKCIGYFADGNGEGPGGASPLLNARTAPAPEVQVTQTQPAPVDDPGPLDLPVTKLKEYLAGEGDVATLNALRDAEKAGKSRSSAMAALDERIAALKTTPDDAGAATGEGDCAATGEGEAGEGSTDPKPLDETKPTKPLPDEEDSAK